MRPDATSNLTGLSGFHDIEGSGLVLVEVRGGWIFATS